MSLPPNFIEELRTRVSLSQVVGRKVVWSKKSNRAKGDWWASCPFHQEKSASFHVDDRKGFYYCFGCHAKGDALTFVQETENVGFMEAVEILAREAGMPMPARDPQAAKKADRRSQLAEVMEEVVKFYRMQLKTGAAQDARAYLDRRGLGMKGQDRFEIGYAPNESQATWNHLKGKGIPDEMIIATGVCAESDRGGAPYDRFRGRIMFPIRDARGRCISFGGRAMDPNARAKYLNGPETELFDKGNSLYNHGPAREAVGRGQTLIVAEGYMDVIALALAGFEGAVAPLGTAITPEQLQLMWRISPEPVIALDGDKAGVRAAYRLVDVALPLLEADKALRFCLMPEGQDPDDLIKAKGPEGMAEILGTAMPLIDILWRRAIEDQVFDSPERKAGLDKRLREEIKQIRSPDLRSHYGHAIKELRAGLFGTAVSAEEPRREWTPRQNWQPRQGGGGRRPWGAPPSKPLGTTLTSALVQDENFEISLREAVVLATIVSTPMVLEEAMDLLEAMECQSQEHNTLRGALLMMNGRSNAFRAELEALVGGEILENLLRQNHISICPSVRRAGDLETAKLTLMEETAKLKAAHGRLAEIAEATEELTDAADEAITYRLGQAALAFDRATRAQQEDTTEYEKADNGMRVDRKEREALHGLLANLGKTPKH